jgi:hypothetical protein
MSRLSASMLVLSAVALGACRDTPSEPGTGLVDFPVVTFRGQVLDEEGAGIHAGLEVRQRFLECDSLSELWKRAESTPDGRFEVRFSTRGVALEGCFVLRAVDRGDTAVVLDSVMLRRADILERRDPPGSWLIDVDVVVRAAR